MYRLCTIFGSCHRVVIHGRIELRQHFRYACKHIYNADTFIPRPGFRWKFTSEAPRKAVVTFTEKDYYQDMAKRKLNL